MKEQFLILFGLLGGLGLFLFGMQIMGEGLQKAAGERMRRILEVLTKNAFFGVLVGAGVTAIIQSSSATTVMLVGFVNAGLMSLQQAIGVVMGANIGTTMTAQLIAFKLTDYTFLIIALGFAITFLSKRKTSKYLGQVLLGFGILLLGMETMSDSMKPLRNSPVFVNMMLTLGKNPLLGVLVGTLMTMLIQSSSATIAILMSVASQGLVDFSTAVPILFGDNIGTTITAWLAAINSNLAAKRTAMSHTMFNVIGTIIFITFLPYFESFVIRISPPGDIARQIANAHTSFNVINTILFLPFVGLYAKLITRILPGEIKTAQTGALYLDKRMLHTPSVALSQVNKEIARMAEIALQNVNLSMEAFLASDEKLLKQVFEQEETVDALEQEITEYLVLVSQQSLTPEQSARMTSLLHVINDIERVGDHAEAIAELADIKIKRKLPYSPEAIKELKEMGRLAANTFKKSVTALETENADLAREVVAFEDRIDRMEKTLRNNHIKRLNECRCFPESGVIYLDIISNLERIGDHSHNIAHVVLGEIT